MSYAPHAPYEILQTSTLDFPTMQRLRRFSRYWDLIANSGQFHSTLPLIWHNDAPFVCFMQLSDWLWKIHQPHQQYLSAKSLRTPLQIPNHRTPSRSPRNSPVHLVRLPIRRPQRPPQMFAAVHCRFAYSAVGRTLKIFRRVRQDISSPHPAAPTGGTFSN